MQIYQENKLINSKYKDLQTTKVHINLSANQRVTGSRKEKRREFFNFLRFSTQTRGRTGMEVNPLVFETSASTDSAIWALVSNAVQRYGFFLNLQEFYKKKEKKRIKDRINTSIFRE